VFLQVRVEISTQSYSNFGLDAVSAGRPYDDPRLTPDSPEWMRAMHEEQVRHFKG
jgi:hypothetical protein